jgi:hypothetical protein
MSFLRDHDKVCEACLEKNGVKHTFGPSYNTETQQWTLVSMEFIACPLWGTDKAASKWKRKRRRSPMVLTKEHIPPGCVYSLEHLMVEENAK